MPVAHLLQIDQDWNKVIQRTQGLLEKVTPNYCIAVEVIDKWNEDKFDDKSEYVFNCHGHSSDSNEDNVVEVPQVLLNTTAKRR